jgi:hypothetical protein
LCANTGNMHAQAVLWKRFSMNGFGKGLRLAAVVLGIGAIAACQSMTESDRAMIEQARADAQAAQAAADRAAEAADRAQAAANEAADAASSATMAAERQARMVQQTVRK